MQKRRVVAAAESTRIAEQEVFLSEMFGVLYGRIDKLKGDAVAESLFEGRRDRMKWMRSL